MRLTLIAGLRLPANPAYVTEINASRSCPVITAVVRESSDSDMNPRDYTTWSTFADHPIFSDKSRPPAEWSMVPELYEGFRCNAFDPEWYVHCDPKLPTDVQAAIAERDLRNLTDTCESIRKRFGAFDHELFILDDFTVFVRIVSAQFTLELYPSHYGDGEEIMTVDIEEPSEREFEVDSIQKIVPCIENVISSE